MLQPEADPPQAEISYLLICGSAQPSNIIPVKKQKNNGQGIKCFINSSLVSESGLT